MEENLNYSPEQLRELGKAYMYNHENDLEKRKQGIDLIIKARWMKDPEASYIVGSLILDGILNADVEDKEAYALRLICFAARKGCVQARAFLNSYCDGRYQKVSKSRPRIESKGGLVDFKGKAIRINRKGIFTPIDAVLENKDGKNILTLSTNIRFFYIDQIENAKEFEHAVIKGLLAWEGEYEVFGGQKVTVNIQFTKCDNLFDNLWVIPVGATVASSIQSVNNAINTGKRKERIDGIVKDKRSFATMGLGSRWSVNSRKSIYIQSADGKFDDYEEIMHLTKHEFGHALGLGDLYESSIDSLKGVSKGTFEELDSYVIDGKYYNLVMCDHHGPISNNDIEMVILAFRKNKMQLYQPRRFKKKISSALGKGN